MRGPCARVSRPIAAACTAVSAPPSAPGDAWYGTSMPSLASSAFSPRTSAVRGMKVAFGLHESSIRRVESTCPLPLRRLGDAPKSPHGSVFSSTSESGDRGARPAVLGGSPQIGSSGCPASSASASASAFTSSTSLKRSSCRIRRRTISRKCSSSSESSSDHVAGVNSALGVVIVPHPRWVPHPLVTALTKKIIGPLDNQSSPTSPRHCLGRARLSDHPRRHRGDPKIVAGSRAGGDIARESPRPGRRRRRQRRDLGPPIRAFCI